MCTQVPRRAGKRMRIRCRPGFLILPCLAVLSQQQQSITTSSICLVHSSITTTANTTDIRALRSCCLYLNLRICWEANHPQHPAVVPINSTTPTLLKGRMGAGGQHRCIPGSVRRWTQRINNKATYNSSSRRHTSYCCNCSWAAYSIIAPPPPPA